MRLPPTAVTTERSSASEGLPACEGFVGGVGRLAGAAGARGGTCAPTLGVASSEQNRISPAKYEMLQYIGFIVTQTRHSATDITEPFRGIA